MGTPTFTLGDTEFGVDFARSSCETRQESCRVGFSPPL